MVTQPMDGRRWGPCRRMGSWVDDSPDSVVWPRDVCWRKRGDAALGTKRSGSNRHGGSTSRLGGAAHHGKCPCWTHMRTQPCWHGVGASVGSRGMGGVGPLGRRRGHAWDGVFVEEAHTRRSVGDGHFHRRHQEMEGVFEVGPNIGMGGSICGRHRVAGVGLELPCIRFCDMAGPQQRGMGANAHSKASAEGLGCTGQGKGWQINPLVVGVSRQFGSGCGRAFKGGRTSSVVLVVGAQQCGPAHSITSSGMALQEPICLVCGILGDGRSRRPRCVCHGAVTGS